MDRGSECRLTAGTVVNAIEWVIGWEREIHIPAPL